MAKFKQVPQSFLIKKLMGFWGNVVKNYRDDVRDDDFFAIVRKRVLCVMMKELLVKGWRDCRAVKVALFRWAPQSENRGRKQAVV